MSLLIGLLTFIIVVNCLILMLLVLIQLPKKESGAGLAFGGGATDALFGAGTGTALTRLTRYAATTFLVLAVSLSVLRAHRAGLIGGGLEQELERRALTPAPAAPAAPGLPAPQVTIPAPETAAPVQPQAEAPAPAAVPAQPEP